MEIRTEDKIAFRFPQSKVTLIDTVTSTDVNSISCQIYKCQREDILGVVVSQAKIKEFLTKMKNQEDSGIFSVDVIKRSNGEYRKMQCQYNVKKHLTGGTKAFDDKENDLKTVYSHDAKGYRSIALEGIVRLACNGRVYLAEEMLSHFDAELNK